MRLHSLFKRLFKRNNAYILCSLPPQLVYRQVYLLSFFHLEAEGVGRPAPWMCALNLLQSSAVALKMIKSGVVS